MPARDIFSVLDRLVTESRRLLVKVKNEHPEMPYDGFEKALLDFESFLPARAKESSQDFKVRRDSMVVGRKYLVHAPSRFPRPMPFEYLGDTHEDMLSDRVSGKTVCLSFFLRWLDAHPPAMPEKVFYADLGVEPYSSGDNEVWHDENWVEEVVDMTEVIRQALNERVSRDDLVDEPRTWEDEA